MEIYLAFGASRMEACKPIAIDGLIMALTPPINQMRFLSVYNPPNVSLIYLSVLGIISIPGMMTGAILGGSSVQQAAKMQMIIMFMISASTALASIFTTAYAISVVVDDEHRIRTDRIHSEPLALWRARSTLIEYMNGSVQRGYLWVRGWRSRMGNAVQEESEMLLETR